MRVLQVHNFYRAATPSGENTVFESEGALLEAAGHQVERYTRSNDEFHDAPLATLMSASLFASHNPWSVAAFRRHVAAFQPDVVHIHNTFPLLSPAILSAARDSGTAVVATLHNYRVICAQGGFLRSHRICTECLTGASAWPSVVHGCYRGRLGSVPVAAAIGWHRRARTWEDSPHALIVLTEFQKALMLQAGFPEGRLHVKGNFTPGAEPVPWEDREATVVYLGRVSEEKGIRTLLDAWELLGSRAPKLRIIGAGEDLADVRERVRASSASSQIELMGTLPHSEAMQMLARSRLLVFPSIWYEPFGLSVIEAYARAVPVLASRIGSLPELVHENRTGALFAPGDARLLSERILALWNNQRELERLALGAHREWELQHAPQANLARLEEIYQVARN